MSASPGAPPLPLPLGPPHPPVHLRPRCEKADPRAARPRPRPLRPRLGKEAVRRPRRPHLPLLPAPRPGSRPRRAPLAPRATPAPSPGSPTRAPTSRPSSRFSSRPKRNRPSVAPFASSSPSPPTASSAISPSAPPTSSSRNRPLLIPKASSTSASPLAAPARPVKASSSALGSRPLSTPGPPPIPDGTLRFALFPQAAHLEPPRLRRRTARIVQRDATRPSPNDLVRVLPRAGRAARFAHARRHHLRDAASCSRSTPPRSPARSACRSTLRPAVQISRTPRSPRRGEARRGVARSMSSAIRYRRPDGERDRGARARTRSRHAHAGPRTGYIDRVTIRFTPGRRGQWTSMRSCTRRIG